MSALPLTQIKRVGADDALIANLRLESPGASGEAGMKLIAEAKSFGLGLRDFLTLKVDPKLTANENQRKALTESKLNGYEATLAVLNLPVKEDLEQGIVLQAASETFQTFPGVRALFPEVIDDMVRWKYRQAIFETVGPLLANSRTVAGVEMISTVVDDKKDDYEVHGTVAEGSRVRVKSIRASENAVRFFKVGGGLRTTYEFERRARLDLLTPYINRMNAEFERSKVSEATRLLVSGDGVHAAAGEVDQSSYNAAVGTNATNGRISYQHLLRWLVARAQAGTPVDTVVGNWDAYIQWLQLFALPTSNNTRTDGENLAAMGFQVGSVPILQGRVDFVLSTTAPANKLIGLSRGDTLEELIEAGSLIQESERSITNQTVTYVRTLNLGYRLAYGDTRSVYDYGN